MPSRTRTRVSFSLKVRNIFAEEHAVAHAYEGIPCNAHGFQIRHPGMPSRTRTRVSLKFSYDSGVRARHAVAHAYEGIPRILSQTDTCTGACRRARVRGYPRCVDSGLGVARGMPSRTRTRVSPVTGRMRILLVRACRRARVRGYPPQVVQGTAIKCGMPSRTRTRVSFVAKRLSPGYPRHAVAHAYEGIHGPARPERRCALGLAGVGVVPAGLGAAFGAQAILIHIRPPTPKLSHSLLASATCSLQRYLPGPPCPTWKQAHGHPSLTLTASMKTAIPDSGRTGPDGTPGCCCGSCGYSCYDWRNAGSSQYCSRNRPESRAGRALACSPAETDLTKNMSS